MKKILLLVNVTLFTFLGFSQVTFYVDPPSGNSGDYVNTYADIAGGDWGVSDLNDPQNAILGTLVLAHDSLACETLINPTEIDGNIAVVYRADCEFGMKAFNAQEAGAIAVVIINHTGDPVEMGGGAQGINVTIPVIMISQQNGALLYDEIVAGTLTCFIGNKNGFYANDIGFGKSDVLRAKTFSNIQGFSQNASEFEVETGALVWNYGSDDQTDVVLTCNIDFNGSSIYNQASTPAPILSGDSLFISFPAFSQATYANGLYNMTYTISYGNTDEFMDDDQVTADFMMSENMWSRAISDPVTDKPVSNSTFFAGGQSQFRACTQFSNANASRKGIKGLTFSAQTSVVNDGIHLDGKLVSIEAYKWNDPITNINDNGFLVNGDGAAILTNLVEIANGTYDYETDLQGIMVSAKFENAFLLEDNQNYVFCVVSEDDQISFGSDTKTDYLSNMFSEASTGSPTTNNGNIVSPVYNDNGWFAIGYGTDVVAAIGLELFDAAELSVEETIENEKIKAFPNPAIDMLTIPFANKEGNATINITDVAGKLISTQQVNLTGINTLKLDVTTIESGMYVFNVAYENGTTSTFNVVINK